MMAMTLQSITRGKYLRITVMLKSYRAAFAVALLLLAAAPARCYTSWNLMAAAPPVVKHVYGFGRLFS
jgi:hypothetical protein